VLNFARYTGPSPVDNRGFHVKQLLGSGSAPSHLVLLAHAPVDQLTGTVGLRMIKIRGENLGENCPHFLCAPRLKRGATVGVLR
jgi:hypothetical protein